MNNEMKYIYEHNGKKEEMISYDLAEHLNTVHTNIEFFIDWCEEMSDILYDNQEEYRNRDMEQFREEINEYLFRMKDLEH